MVVVIVVVFVVQQPSQSSFSLGFRLGRINEGRCQPLVARIIRSAGISSSTSIRFTAGEGYIVSFDPTPAIVVRPNRAVAGRFVELARRIHPFATLLRWLRQDGPF